MTHAVLSAFVSDGVTSGRRAGGGSGHEPAFGGFVGDGMLSAAVCGGVFASPSVDEVLAAIRSVTGPAGCLLCLMNYTGDRLNFGLAAERAKVSAEPPASLPHNNDAGNVFITANRSPLTCMCIPPTVQLEGYNVEMVIVGEDCALPPPRGLAGRRGLAGTLLCLKVAGAAAAAGLPLAAVLAETTAAAKAVGTMGVALTSCTLPGCAPSMRIPPGEMVRAHRAPSEEPARARERSPCVVQTDRRPPSGHLSANTPTCGLWGCSAHVVSRRSWDWVFTASLARSRARFGQRTKLSSPSSTPSCPQRAATCHCRLGSPWRCW